MPNYYHLENMLSDFDTCIFLLSSQLLVQKIMQKPKHPLPKWPGVQCSLHRNQHQFQLLLPHLRGRNLVGGNHQLHVQFLRKAGLPKIFMWQKTRLIRKTSKQEKRAWNQAGRLVNLITFIFVARGCLHFTGMLGREINICLCFIHIFSQIVY